MSHLKAKPIAGVPGLFVTLVVFGLPSGETLEKWFVVGADRADPDTFDQAELDARYTEWRAMLPPIPF